MMTGYAIDSGGISGMRVWESTDEFVDDARKMRTLDVVYVTLRLLTYESSR